MLFLLTALLGAVVLADKARVSHGEKTVIESSIAPGNVLPQYLFLQGLVEGGDLLGVSIGGGRGEKRPYMPPDEFPEKYHEYASPDMRARQLPRLRFDLWGCEREEDTLPMIVLENERFKLELAPTVGGKIYAMRDKLLQKDVFFDNKAHQPANIGSLGAWSAGGCEWNWAPGIFGHSAFSELPVYVAQLDTDMGPALRVYEFDRYNHTAWQVDLMLDDEEPLLWVHVTTHNPTTHDVDAYWWTCVAHEINDASRVVASRSARRASTSQARRRMNMIDFPFTRNFGTSNGSYAGYKDGPKQMDVSRMGNLLEFSDFFLESPDESDRFIAHVEGDGFSVVHGHDLEGTKYWQWGRNGHGRFFMDFLSAQHGPIRAEQPLVHAQLVQERLQHRRFSSNTDDVEHTPGHYNELQVGPAATQQQTWLLPQKSTRSWLEWFAPFQGDKAKMMGEYDEALDEVYAHTTAAYAKRGRMQEFLARVAQREVREEMLLHKGASWASQHDDLLRVLGKENQGRTPGHLLFSRDITDKKHAQEVRPFDELLRDGTFSEETLALMPVSYQTHELWEEVIHASAERRGWTWLHHLYIGVIEAERGLRRSPRQHFEACHRLRPNAHCLRNLAVMQYKYADAWPLWQSAWRFAVAEEELAFDHADSVNRLRRNLAVEILYMLMGQQERPAKWELIDHDGDDDVDVQDSDYWLNELDRFVNVELPKARNFVGDIDQLDPLIAARVVLAVRKDKDYPVAKTLLRSHCFPTYGMSRRQLIELWYQAAYGERELLLGRPLSTLEMREVRMQAGMPRNIGCAYTDEQCKLYW